MGAGAAPFDHGGGRRMGAVQLLRKLNFEQKNFVNVFTMGAGGGTYNAPINFSQILFLLLNEKYDIIKGDIYINIKI